MSRHPPTAERNRKPGGSARAPGARHWGARFRSRRLAGSLQPRWHERLRQWFADRRRGGRLPRTTRKLVAAALVVAAGILAVRPPDSTPGQLAVALTRDLPVGARLEPRDVQPIRMVQVPDGAVQDIAGVIGSPLAAAARRGEVLTDVRLAHVIGPDPGAGRVAVPIRPADPAIVGLLGPGMHIAVLSVGEDRAAVVLAPDAVVLALVDAPEKGTSERPIVVAVPAASANAVVGATVAGTIALRFT